MLIHFAHILRQLTFVITWFFCVSFFVFCNCCYCFDLNINTLKCMRLSYLLHIVIRIEDTCTHIRYLFANKMPFNCIIAPNINARRIIWLSSFYAANWMSIWLQGCNCPVNQRETLPLTSTGRISHCERAYSYLFMVWTNLIIAMKSSMQLSRICLYHTKLAD